MTLLEVYEELFEYLCRLNRAGKSPVQPDYERVRGDLSEMLERIPQKAGGDVRLQNQIRTLELPVLYVVDNLICTSSLQFRDKWADHRLAVKLKNDLAGDERFFDFLEQDISDPSDDARERLAVYYTALGLGFTGMYSGQPERINSYINQIYPRIAPFMNRNPASRITEQAYKNTNTTILTQPPSRMVVVVAVVFIFFALSAMAVYYGLYHAASKEVSSQVDDIVKVHLAHK
jgi:type IV/VI secretion system ImpK/VasF family protein